MTLLIRLIVGALIGWYGMGYLREKGFGLLPSLGIIFLASFLAGLILTSIFHFLGV